MNIQELRDYCLNKKGTIETYPFDETTMVMKVGSKMYCLADIEHIPFSFTVKCDPERAIDLREQYQEVTPGYHCNKKHWNTVTPSGELRENELYKLIDHSYDLVYSSLKKSEKAEIETL